MKKLTLALLISAAASQANAIQMNLVSVESQNWEKFANDGGGASTAGRSVALLEGGNDYAGNVGDTSTPIPYAASTASWQFDGTTLTGDGSYNAHWIIHPWWSLFDQSIEGLSIVIGGEASASSYECIEGNFGALVSGNLCGNYDMGANYINESSMVYNVGGDARNQSRILAGDDVAIGNAQALADFDNTTVDDNATYAGLFNSSGQLAMSTYSWDGITLKIHNMTGNTTQTLTFSAVPVPAAAWLFGSAVLGLAGLKRKQIKK
jgi:hypothetical protein